jgi:hypothetical protein
VIGQLAVSSAASRAALARSGRISTRTMAASTHCHSRDCREGRGEEGRARVGGDGWVGGWVVDVVVAYSGDTSADKYNHNLLMNRQGAGNS